MPPAQCAVLLTTALWFSINVPQLAMPPPQLSSPSVACPPRTVTPFRVKLPVSVMRKTRKGGVPASALRSIVALVAVIVSALAIIGSPLSPIALLSTWLRV